MTDAKPASALRRYTWKMYPNVAQAAALGDMARLHSDLYNALIQQRHEAWSRQHKSLSCYQQQLEFKHIRREFPEYGELSSKSMEVTAERVDHLFRQYFRLIKEWKSHRTINGIKADRPPQPPRYRRCEGFGFKRPASGWQFYGTHVYLKGIPGRVRVRGKFPASPIAIKTCDLTWHAGAWWLSIAAEMPPRMRRDADQVGEVTFNLIEEFARVRRVDGGRETGPAETAFYVAANGRIAFATEGVTTGSGADTGQLQGERGINPSEARIINGADTGQMQGERGGPIVPPQHQGGADTGQLLGERGRILDARTAVRGADTGQLQGERGLWPFRSYSPAGVDTGQMQGERGATRRCPPPVAGADAEQKRGERGGSQTRPGGSSATRVEILQRKMAQCRRGSSRYQKLRRLKQRQEARQARRRSDALHVWTTKLTRRFKSLVITAPRIAEITASAAGSIYDPGALVSVKAELNRHILAQAPAAAMQMLAYKLTERGGFVETRTAEEPRASVGNELVAAAKANRQLRRTIRAS